METCQARDFLTSFHDICSGYAPRISDAMLEQVRVDVA
jgi:hypothetical protein